MKRLLTKFFILAGMLLGLPLLGVFAAGFPVTRYLEFPPTTHYVRHRPFSWAAFVLYGLFILIFILPLLIRGIRAGGRQKKKPEASRPFPWWGWLAMLTGITAWILAWTRFSWFSAFQPHTFTPLWFSFILIINALAYHRKGSCMMLERPGYFLLLFPASATFWWFFEYLNRFVQNWYYMGPPFSAWEYFWYATLPFSTVLPAVLGVRDWIGSFSWTQAGYGNFLPLQIPHPKHVAWFFLLSAGAGLAGIGVWPNYLFPLLWVSPLLIIISLQTLMGEQHIFMDIAKGDWRLVVTSALAALFCGWFWEMWNYYSLAKWEYSVPFVQGFLVFEMPVLGYAGYLPFGLEIAVIGEMLSKKSNPNPCSPDSLRSGT